MKKLIQKIYLYYLKKKKMKYNIFIDNIYKNINIYI